MNLIKISNKQITGLFILLVYTFFIFSLITQCKVISRKNIIHEEFLKKMEKLKEDMKNNNCEINDNIKIKFISKDNRFLAAADDIQENTNLIKIPFKYSLNVLNEEIKKFCRGLNTTEFSTDEILINHQTSCLQFFILHEKKFPTSQKYQSYIDILPKSLKEYHFFWPNEIKELLNPSLFNDYLKADIESLGEFKKLINKTKFRDQFSEEEIINAFILTNSRAFGILIGDKEYSVMIPLTDMPNHDHLKINTYWNRRIENENDFLTLTTIEKIKGGDQIYLDYGRYENQLFLTEYGFLIENNPFLIDERTIEVTVRNKKFNVKLKMGDLKNLVKSLEIIRNGILKDQKNSKEVNNRDIDKESIEAIISVLNKYRNVERLEKLKNRTNESYILLNIYKVLKEELVLLNYNLANARTILRLLKSKTSPQLQYPDDPIYLKNKNYFDPLFS